MQSDVLTAAPVFDSGGKPKSYKRTYAGCFLGIVNQATVSIITAILFVPFMTLYNFQLWQLGVFVGINFGIQTIADILLTFIIDKVGFRPLVLIAAGLSSLGLILMGLLPFFVPADQMFWGIVAATSVFAFSSGMLEVVISPIIDNIPEGTKGKGGAMSLMHSFYAWGQLFCILATSLYLLLAGNANWNYILFAFAVLPIISLIVFLRAPLDKKPAETHAKAVGKTFFSPFFIVAILAIMFGGASEVIMNQWTSTFVVTALGFSKATADLIGMAFFAVSLGVGRLLYAKFGHKINMHKVLIFGSLLTAVIYILVGVVDIPVLALILSCLCGFTASLLWPGTLVVTSKKFPTAGAWIFAVLAITGDIGAAIGPAATGFIAEGIGLKLAFLIMAVVPLAACGCHIILAKSSTKPK